MCEKNHTQCASDERAVNSYSLTRYEVGAVAGEEEHEPRYLLGRAEASHR